MRLRCLVLSVLLALLATVPASADHDWNHPPSAVPFDSTPVAGLSTRSPLTLPGSGRLFGLNHAFCHNEMYPPPGTGRPCSDEATHRTDMGANTVRMQPSWYKLRFHGWEDETDFVNDAAAKIDAVLRSLPPGQKVIMQLQDVPEDHRALKGDLESARNSAPEDDADSRESFNKYVRRVLATWGPTGAGWGTELPLQTDRIAAVEVFNEVNTNYYWKMPLLGSTTVPDENRLPDPGHYVRYFQVAAEAGDDFGVPVYIGGLLNHPNEDRGYSIQKFMRMLYAAGLRPRWASGAADTGYDGLAFHFYVRVDDHDYSDLDTQLAQAVNDWRNGYLWADPGASLLLTEIGASTGPLDQPAIDWSLSEPDQAEAIERMLRYFGGMPEVDGIIIHQLYDYPAGPGDQAYRGLITSSRDSNGVFSYDFKASYCRMRSLSGGSLTGFDCPAGDSISSWPQNKPPCANGGPDDTDGLDDYPADPDCRDPGDGEGVEQYGPLLGYKPWATDPVPHRGTLYTTMPGKWTGQPAPGIARQWWRCDLSNDDYCPTKLTGQTWSSYTPVFADVGRRLKLIETATGADGSVTASFKTDPVQP